MTSIFTIQHYNATKAVSLANSWQWNPLNNINTILLELFVIPAQQTQVTISAILRLLITNGFNLMIVKLLHLVQPILNLSVLEATLLLQVLMTTIMNKKNSHQRVLIY